MANVDDDALKTKEFVFVVRGAEVDRAGFFGAGGFHHAKLLSLGGDSKILACIIRRVVEIILRPVEFFRRSKIKNI
jgi:hypothetical protein